MPGMNPTGTKTDSSTSVIAMIGAVISPIAFFVASGAGSRGLLHHVLDVFDHHDGIVDDDADGENHGEHRDGVGE